MITIRKNSTDSRKYSRASIGDHHKHLLGIKSSSNKMGKEKLPCFSGFPLTLDKSKMLPLSILCNPNSTESSLRTYSLSSDLKVGSINDQIGNILADRSIQPPDQLLLNILVHSADLSRADLRAPQKIGDLIYLSGRNTSEEHLGDNVLYLAVLTAVPLQDAAVADASFPAQRDLNILNNSKSGLQRPFPDPITIIPAIFCSLIRLRPYVPHELVFGVFLQHGSHEISNSYFHIIKKITQAFKLKLIFITLLLKCFLINNLLLCYSFGSFRFKKFYITFGILPMI